MPEPGPPDLFPVPVLFLVFNRPAATRRVFDRIAQVRPATLLIVADGPRPDREGEKELCQEVREIVSVVHWPCEVLTNFAPDNLGCFQRVATGLDWAFTIVERAIVLEDDCLPDTSFFPFCQELLERYRADFRISFISGTNLVGQQLNAPYDYYFSRQGRIWGWATWRSRWQDYDRYLKGWPELRRSGALRTILDRPRDIAYWTAIFDAMFEGGKIDTWDYQWVYTNFFKDRMAIVPRNNLIMNIGFGAGATHTVYVDPRLISKPKAISFPLRHPAAIVPSRSFDRDCQDLCYPPPLWRRIAIRINRLVNPLHDRQNWRYP